MKYIKISYFLGSETFSSDLNPNYILPILYLNKSSPKLSSKSHTNIQIIQIILQVISNIDKKKIRLTL